MLKLFKKMIKQASGKPKIFINYRRDDSKGTAGRIYDKLSAVLGKDYVFRDINTIGAGKELDATILREIECCNVFLVVIGKQWLTSENGSDQSRLFAENDTVRTEIEEAMRLCKTIIPVLVDDSKALTANQLPESIRSLATLNAIEITDKWFDDDMSRMISGIYRPSMIIRFGAKLATAIALIALGYWAWRIISHVCTPVIFYSGQSPDTAYYKLSAALAKFIHEDSLHPDYSFVIEKTAGSVENCQKMEVAEKNLTEQRIAFHQLTGNKDNAPCNRNSMKYVAPLYKELVHFAIRKSHFNKLVASSKPPQGTLTFCDFIRPDSKVKVAVGPAGSTTNYMANEFLKACNDPSTNSQEMPFTDMIKVLNTKDDEVVAAFINQAALSPLIEQLREADICFLSLDDNISDSVRESLHLAEYILPETGKINEFYKEKGCNPKGDTFKSLYSMSVLAININTDSHGAEDIDDNQRDLVWKLLNALYDRTDKLRDIVPELLTFEEAQKLIKEDNDLSEHGGTIYIHDEASKFFSSDR